jgi:hypothetical protein
MVAMEGEIMAAPLATPTTRAGPAAAEATLMLVSVVRMEDAKGSTSRDREPAAPGRAATMRSTARGIPMGPVDATSTS